MAGGAISRVALIKRVARSSRRDATPDGGRQRQGSLCGADLQLLGQMVDKSEKLGLQPAQSEGLL